MKKIFSLTILIFALSFSFPTLSLAHGIMDENNTMDGNSTVLQNDNGHTALGEADGKEIWEKFQTSKLKCTDLSDENFRTLGEYFMGKMVGDSHKAMNNMMVRMMGEDGEKEMHVAMGKRMSDCEPNAAMPQNMMNSGMMKMMMGSGGMMGGGSRLNSSALNNSMSMMNFSFSSLGWIFMIFFWILVIIGIVALIKWIVGQSKIENKHHKYALDILKERYARGEIDKKEFEEKKKKIE